MKDKFLEGNFYSLTKSEVLSGENTQFSANVLLNPGHPVYKGHFPEMPVAPGVALIGMIQEILEGQLHKNLFLSEASDIKFIRLILPGEHTEFTINYSLKFADEKTIEANINIKSGDQIFIKIRCKFTVVNFPA